MLLLWTALAMAGPEVVADDPSGTLRRRLVHDDADVVLLYGSGQDGEVGPCGCDAVERGGMERIRGYSRAVEKTGSPVILLNAGGWLDARPGQSERNDAMVQQVADWDALNVGFREPVGLGRYVDRGTALAADLRPQMPTSLVSASVQGPGTSTWKTVIAGTTTVAITGVSPTTAADRWPQGFGGEEPVAALRAALASAPEADLVVVLAYETGAATDELAALPGVDVLIEAGGYTARWDASTEQGALWVRSTQGSTRLGELRLWLDEDAVVRAVDRQVPVDVAIPKRRRRP
ncbi:MAG: hypothetical protein KC912_10895 [Proteobacteria bacterium]|nr:hypothetical protein [Pseudomonadota bacterium]